MIIRKATIKDIEKITEVYERARKYMRENGNPTQWGNSYPPKSLIESDINLGISYVIEEKNQIHGVFVFFVGEEPTYNEIDGSWLNNNQYGVLHRIGSDGRVSGVVKAVTDFAKEQVKDIRIDTHENNHTMQHLLEKYGFTKCGIIHLEDGQPRLAYHCRVTSPSVIC